MANRLQYYFREKVTETELNEGFDGLELAIRNQTTDLGLIGVLSGLQVVQHAAGANTTVDIAAGVAYDKAGERIAVLTTQTVDVSVDSLATTTSVVGTSNSKILSLFAAFSRTLTDPRTDGNSITVYFNEAESFSFVVRQGAEAPTPTPPPLDTTMILLADITRVYGVTAITNSYITVNARREDAVKHTGSPHTLREGLILNGLFDLYDIVNAHLSATADRHNATAIDYSGASSTYLTLGAETVAAAISQIAQEIGSTSGASYVGAGPSAAPNFFGTNTSTVQANMNLIAQYADAGPLGRLSSTYSAATALSSERLIFVNTTGSAFTLTLPAPQAGREIVFKDQKGTFGTNALTIAPHGAEMIEGVAAGLVCSAPWGNYTLRSDGTNWLKGG